MYVNKLIFSAGKHDVNEFYIPEQGLDDSGNPVDEAGRRSYYLSALPEGYTGLYLAIDTSKSRYSRVYFYNAQEKLIQLRQLNGINGWIITFPPGAKYFSLRFSDDDEPFYHNRDKGFVYFIKTVTPHYKQLKKKIAKENNQEFFRESIDGKITLFGSDYELIRNANLEDELIFTIHQLNRNTGNYERFYQGTFNKTNCKFNYTRRSCEIEVTTLDAYNKIMSSYDKDYDLVKLKPAVTRINMYMRPLIQLYVLGSSSISNYIGGTYWEEDVNEVVTDENTLLNTYRFAKMGDALEFKLELGEQAVPSDFNEEVLGIYAGIAHNTFIKKDRKYIITAEPTDATGLYYKVYVRRMSDNSVQLESPGVSPNSFPNIIHDNLGFSMPGDGFVFVWARGVIESHIYGRMLCNTDSISTDTSIVQTNDIDISDFASTGSVYKKCVGFNGGNLYCTAYVVDEPTIYGINENPDEYFTNKFISSVLGTGRLMPVCKSSWANSSIWYTYPERYNEIEQSARKEFVLRDAYSICDAIKALLKEIDPSIQHEATEEYSQFLYSAQSPLSLARFYVYITPKSNVLKANYDQAAQTGEISLEMLMNMLRDCFKCYWYIEDNKFKIEHIRFFMKGGSYSSDVRSVDLDLTGKLDTFNGQRILYDQTEVEYDKDELPSRYEFSWMDDVTTPFSGVTVDVNSNYVQKDKTNDVAVNSFTSDVDYMILNPNACSSDGFALLCVTQSGGTYSVPIFETQLIDENGDSYDATLQNGYAAWSYLVNFYRYDAPARNMVCNVTGAVSSVSLVRAMKHEVRVPYDKNIAPYSLIKTDVGMGEVEEISTDVDTLFSDVAMNYELS